MLPDLNIGKIYFMCYRIEHNILSIGANDSNMWTNDSPLCLSLLVLAFTCKETSMLSSLWYEDLWLIGIYLESNSSSMSGMSWGSSSSSPHSSNYSIIFDGGIKDDPHIFSTSSRNFNHFRSSMGKIISYALISQVVLLFYTWPLCWSTHWCVLLSSPLACPNIFLTLLYH